MKKNSLTQSLLSSALQKEKNKKYRVSAENKLFSLHMMGNDEGNGIREDSEKKLINSYNFIVKDNNNPKIAEVRKLASYILNIYFKKDYSVSKYLKNHRYIKIVWYNNKGKEFTAAFSFQEIVNDIQKNRTFRVKKFNLPPLSCDWLDGLLISMSKPDAPIQTVDGSEYAKFELVTPFGKKFPIRPCIDREGIAYASLQTPLLNNIIYLYRKLVDNSYLALEHDGIWLNDLRVMLNDCISIVDVSLHQLYYMAKYKSDEKGWNFNPIELDKRDGMRLKDKFKWIGRITGRPLDNAEKEIKNFEKIKNIRNHFNHFDPPCLAYTIEDLVVWFNIVPDIGRLLWKIREKLKVQLNKQIIEIITLPKVKFIPRISTIKRLPLHDDVGYKSSIWRDI